MPISSLEALSSFNAAKQEAYEFIKGKEKPSSLSSAGFFLRRILNAVKLVFQEPEIILFSLAQVVVIGICYFLFIQIFKFIPDEAWQRVDGNKNHGSFYVDTIINIWAIICVGIAAFPIGILSGATGAAHFLHRAGRESTISSCLKMAYSNAWAIWIFSWIDGWITVNRIYERLPRRKDNRTRAEKLVAETLYYAWKLLTLGMLPALLVGRTPAVACKESILFLKDKYGEVIALRIGYSFFCWIVGVLAYILGAYLINTSVLPDSNLKTSDVMLILTQLGVPIIIAVAAVQIMLRPIYLITACDIYADYLKSKGQQPDLPEGSLSYTVAFLFLLLCGLAFVLYYYADALGVTKLLAAPYS